MAQAHSERQYVGAYLIEGDVSTLDTLVETLKEKEGIERGNPDLYARAYHSFGIDDARAIRERAERKALTREGRVFAIFAPGMTADAQNALLKTLEEPSAGALFFIIVPSPQMLLPTLRSRMQVLHLEKGKRDSEVDGFLAASTAKRMEMVKDIYEHDESEGRDMAKVLSFLQSLEERFAREKPSAKRDEGLRAIYRARKFAGDKGSLLKALLEQIALLVPKI